MQTTEKCPNCWRYLAVNPKVIGKQNWLIYSCECGYGYSARSCSPDYFNELIKLTKGKTS